MAGSLHSLASREGQLSSCTALLALAAELGDRGDEDALLGLCRQAVKQVPSKQLVGKAALWLGLLTQIPTQKLTGTTALMAPCGRVFERCFACA